MSSKEISPMCVSLSFARLDRSTYSPRQSDDEGCPDNRQTFSSIGAVKRPACRLLAIMDNSRDLKTHAGRRLNERASQSSNTYLFSLFLSLSFDLILKFIDSSSRPINEHERERDDHGENMSVHLNAEGHCPASA
jgi:hypothetical protein